MEQGFVNLLQLSASDHLSAVCSFSEVILMCWVGATFFAQLFADCIYSVVCSLFNFSFSVTNTLNERVIRD
jgi:hypothetical protein